MNNRNKWIGIAILFFRTAVKVNYGIALIGLQLADKTVSTIN